MKPLIIYHDHCADGFGAAFAAWLKFRDEAEYLPMQYGKIRTPSDFDLKESVDVRGRDVYVLDFSFPKPVMDALFSQASRVVWLDHHKSAFEMWCGKYERGMRYVHLYESWEPTVLAHNKSSALLAWEYFHPGNEVPMLIKHIDDYDRWQFKLEGTKEFQKALWSYAPWSFEQWNDLFNTSNDYSHMLIEGAAILRAHEANVQAIVNGASRKCTIIPVLINSVDSYKAPWVWWIDPDNGDTCGASGLAANCPPHLASDVGHQLANQSGTYGLLWSVDRDCVKGNDFGHECVFAKCSLRSNGDYDVSVIAKAFGGGGHKNAAGFEVPISTLLEWIK